MIKGYLVPNITLFSSDGVVDLDRTAWHMRWMFDHGVDGLFLTGSYGAGPLMSLDERTSIFELARSVVDGMDHRPTLIAHVGCIDTASTLALARRAEATGMDAVGAVPPYYYKHSEDAVLGFYTDLVKGTSLPVYAYNNPETSRFTFSMGFVRRLLEAGLAGMKDSPVEVGFVSRVFYEMKLARAPFELILGTSKGWLPYHDMGVRAMIAGMGNWAPEIITALVRATDSGDRASAELLYVVMMDLSAKMHYADSTILSHMALHARGFDGGQPRRPMMLPPLDDPKYATIAGWIAEAFERVGIRL